MVSLYNLSTSVPPAVQVQFETEITCQPLTRTNTQRRTADIEGQPTSFEHWKRSATKVATQISTIQIFSWTGMKTPKTPDITTTNSKPRYLTLVRMSSRRASLLAPRNSLKDAEARTIKAKPITPL